MTPSSTVTTHPLGQLTLEQAIAYQFRLVDLMHQHFDGREALEAGDFGASPALGRSRTTARVERVLAEFFGADDAVLVTGAGTGAIRAALMATLAPGSLVLTHAAPLYATTAVTFRAMGIERLSVDLNDRQALRHALARNPAMVYLQHSRQLLEDAFELREVITQTRERAPNATIMVDDNYTAMQVPQIGVEMGADLSAFSLFKLLGEPGVGCVLGRRALTDRIRSDAYSGGSKIQGPDALTSLKALVLAPVALAIQSQVVDAVVERLNAGEVSGVRRALPANHQERAVLVELDAPIVSLVLNEAWRLGATPHPVGSHSRFETQALIYPVSRALREAQPELAERMLRVSPFRSGPDTIVRILRGAIASAAAQSGS